MSGNGFERRIGRLEAEVKPKGEYSITDIRFWFGRIRMVFRGKTYIGQVNFDVDGNVEAVHGDVPEVLLEYEQGERDDNSCMF